MTEPTKGAAHDDGESFPTKPRFKRRVSWELDLEIGALRDELDSRVFDHWRRAWIDKRFVRSLNAAVSERGKTRFRARAAKFASVLAGLVVPILAGASVTKAEAPWIPWAILGFSVLGAIAIGADQVLRDSTGWRLSEALLNDLLRAGWKYVVDRQTSGVDSPAPSVGVPPPASKVPEVVKPESMSSQPTEVGGPPKTLLGEVGEGLSAASSQQSAPVTGPTPPGTVNPDAKHKKTTAVVDNAFSTFYETVEALLKDSEQSLISEITTFLTDAKNTKS
jgi:hypothetical protein